MRYLVVQHEMAYITKRDGNGVEDAWDAPKNKWFQPMSLRLEDDESSSEAFKNVQIIDKI